MEGLRQTLNSIYGSSITIFSYKENYNKSLEYRERIIESPLETCEIHEEYVSGMIS